MLYEVNEAANKSTKLNLWKKTDIFINCFKKVDIEEETVSLYLTLKPFLLL